MKSKPIRLTTTSYAVFSLIEMLGGEATSYDLKQYLERSIANFWHIPHTTFYAEPQRLAGGGYLSEQQETGGRRRRRYTLTALGKEALRTWTQSTEVAPPQLHDEGILKIFAGADPVPILTAQRDWHLAKLAELRGCLEEVRAASAVPCGPERSLLAGLGYHSVLLEQIEGFLAGELQADAAAEPQTDAVELARVAQGVGASPAKAAGELRADAGELATPARAATGNGSRHESPVEAQAAAATSPAGDTGGG